MELVLQSIKQRREDISLKFGKKCTKTEKVKVVFLFKEKYPDMDMRNEEKYVVKYAEIERLMKPAVPYMQR